MDGDASTTFGEKNSLKKRKNTFSLITKDDGMLASLK